MENFLTGAIKGDLIRHMLEQPEEEICGLIIKSGDTFAYERTDNVHPENGKRDDEGNLLYRFRLAPKVTARVKSKKSNVMAYCHSHPAGPNCPSKKDMETQISVGKPAVIVTKDPTSGIVEVFSHGDHLLDAPLDSRPFRHGSADCMEALRSWIWQNEGRYIAPCAREDMWYNKGQKENGALDYDELEQNENLYVNNYEKEGYRAFTPEIHSRSSKLRPKRGDVILFQFSAPVINHAAIYVGDNKIYHHRLGKLSGETSVGYLLGQHLDRMWLRHESNFDE